jgi:flagellar basal body-associated protein FliL
MERLIHIYGLLAIALILLVAASVAYLYWLRSKEKKDRDEMPDRKPQLTREETETAIVFRDIDGYIVNIVNK